MVIALGALVASGLAGLGAAWLALVDPPGGPGEEVSIIVPPGSSVADIATRLAKAEVVPSPLGFKVSARLAGSGQFQSGEYVLRERMGARQAIAALEEGPRVRYQRLLVREGLTLREIAEAVGRLPGRDAKRFLDLATSGSTRSALQPAGVDTLEGLLFPDTYFITDKDDEQAILDRLIGRFEEVATEVRIVGRSTALAREPYDTVVIASLIEAEARVAEDRPLISAVIANRLREGMRLQIDATVLYALGKHKERVLLTDLEVKSPYNTYMVDGLPPTPIAAVSHASLRAALSPAAVDYRFYVLAEENGKHAFAATEGEFFRLKAEARRKGLL
ncbi:MAG: endolytic transglycosylase MltG [Acidimicrobiia bacterium]